MQNIRGKAKRFLGEKKVKRRVNWSSEEEIQYTTFLSDNMEEIKEYNGFKGQHLFKEMVNVIETRDHQKCRKAKRFLGEKKVKRRVNWSYEEETKYIMFL